MAAERAVPSNAAGHRRVARRTRGLPHRRRRRSPPVGARDVHERRHPRRFRRKSRRVQAWAGYLCGDAHTIVAVNVTPLDKRSLAESVAGAHHALSRGPGRRSIVVPGSPRAERLDGVTETGSPAEPQTLSIVFAIARDELVMLSVRSWPRDDVGREVERIIGSFEIAGVVM